MESRSRRNYFNERNMRWKYLETPETDGISKDSISEVSIVVLSSKPETLPGREISERKTLVKNAKIETLRLIFFVVRPGIDERRRERGKAKGWRRSRERQEKLAVEGAS